MDRTNSDLGVHRTDLQLAQGQVQDTVGSVSDDDGQQQQSQEKALQSAKEHIQQIRKYKGLDLVRTEEPTANAEDLKNALNVLSDQLYSQPTHFLLEFIQNADDNCYEAIVPTISFSITRGHLQIDCNEIGFSPTNVDAICRIGKSTKSDRSKGFIGEKGIGFKSVFKVADVVWISSNAYRFKFDRSAPLGMIAPIWEDFPGEARSDTSQFYLQLAQDDDEPAETKLLEQLQCLDSTLLLFLRKLKRIEICIGHQDWKKRLTIHITRTDHVSQGGELIKIEKNLVKTKKVNETSSFLIVRRTIDSMPTEHKRAGMQRSEVVLAFPLAEHGPTFNTQKAYAFLPIRESGFKFLLQADFILIANREDIEKANRWNDRLLTGLADCFVDAVARFNSSDSNILRYTWLGFLGNMPKPESNSFARLTDGILSRLTSIPILESQCGKLVSPVGSYFIPSAFQNGDGQFVMNCAGEVHRYLSANYQDNMQAILEMMGVEVMSFARLLEVLKGYMVDRTAEFRNQDAAWHSMLSKILFEGASDLELQSLPLIPLQTGRWISKVEGQAYFASKNALTSVNTPEGVPQLHIVDQGVSKEPQRRKLLERLGIKDLDKSEVCRLIGMCHAMPRPPDLTVDAYVSHATYLFEASSAGVSSPKRFSFWVLDRDGEARESKNMYFGTVKGSAHQIDNLLEGSSWHSCLLHPGYLLAYKGRKLEKWIKWLETHLAIRSTLRIVVQGELTPEFQHIRKTQTSPLVLDILIDSCSKESGQLTSKCKQEIGGIDVHCEAGEVVHLNKTCLPSPALKDGAPQGIHYLKLDKPFNPTWRKLQDFGVVIEPDLRFYIQCLSLAQKGEPTRPQITQLYRNIDRHWIEDPSVVTDHFVRADNRAVWVPSRKEWVHKNKCVWQSAPGFRGEIILADVYPELHSFFFHRLKVPSATVGKIIQELLMNTGPNALDTERRKELIFTLSAFLKKSPKDSNKLHPLKDVPLIPVADRRYGTAEIKLSALNRSWWFFADNHHHSRSFRDKVSFADFRIGDYHRLASLDEAVQRIWGCQPLRLSSSVVEVQEHGPGWTLHADGTDSLRRKARYLRGLARAANPRISRDLERRFHKLNSVALYISPNMVVRSSITRGQVGNTTLCGAPVPGRIMFQEVETEFQIFVHPKSLNRGRPPPKDTSEGLCKWYDISGDKMRACLMEVLIEEDDQEIEDMLSVLGIGGFDSSDQDELPVQVAVRSQVPYTGDLTRSSAETTGVQSVPAVAPSGRNNFSVGVEAAAKAGPEATILGQTTNCPKQSKVSYQGFSSTTTSEATSREMSQVSRQAQVPAGIRIGAHGPPPQKYPHAETTWTETKAVPRHVLKPTIRSSRQTSSQAFTGERPMGNISKRDESREELIGIRGELAIFLLLKDVLGEALDERGWTSELRHQASHFTPWHPDDPTIVYSDFTIQDPTGKLIDWMLVHNVQVPATWLVENNNRGESPTYHIEVKSTTRKGDDPFFMSHLQMDKAKSLAEQASSKARSNRQADRFIIFRVYDIGLEDRDRGQDQNRNQSRLDLAPPGLDVYCDPWTLICAGESLQCKTQEWRVQSV